MRTPSTPWVLNESGAVVTESSAESPSADY
jgi:hypothetical protein